ncbi:CPBP family intramembrane glutamic endopeptidase [Sphingobacterium suaedae]|uniref:CPBP family intramembrane glutamic endopeptidase n=1 Tax=Sphingobacterium suaedae TaxID=1686402 RepID=A0ABW5KGB1_9SPHI
MNLHVAQERNPWSDLVVLFAWTLGCTILVQLLLMLGGAMLNQDLLALTQPSVGKKPVGVFSYLVLGGSSVGTFLIPALIYQRARAATDIFPAQNWRDWKTYVFGIVFLVAFSPCMSIISDWNMQMTFPEGMRGVENWMREQEDMMAHLTAQTVMVNDVGRLLANVLVIGILPAVSEEFFFRGALQQIFARVLKHEQFSIWIVAIIFSAIHFQFYGFFPRMLLGVFFGYLVVWTGNIWTAVFAHFVNNTSVTILAFYYASENKTYDELVKSDSYSIIVYLGSLFISVAVAYLFFRYTAKKKIYGEQLG